MKPNKTLIALADDLESLRQIAHLLREQFVVITTSNPKEAMSRLESDRSVVAIIVEQVLRSGLGIDLLEMVKQLRPNVRRIVATGFSDISDIVNGLHSGAVDKIISKPLIEGELNAVLRMPSARAAGPLAIAN